MFILGLVLGLVQFNDLFQGVAVGIFMVLS